MKVRNMTSKKTGRKVANQFIIEDGIGENWKVCFQSYNTVIAEITSDGLILDDNAENYSRTTSKYLYQFIKEYVGENYACREELHRFKRANLNV